MKKLATLLLAGLFVLALSAPAYAHDGKSHGKSVTARGHSVVSVSAGHSVVVVVKGKGQTKGAGAANANQASKKRTLVVVGTVQAHRITTPSGEIDVSFAYGNAAAARFVHDVETDGVITFKYNCLKFLGTGVRAAKNCTRVATAGKIKAKVAGDLKEGDLVIVVSDHNVLPAVQDQAILAKLVTIKRLGVGHEGVIHSVNTVALNLVLGTKEGKPLHRDITVGICQTSCTSKGKPFTLIYIGKTLSDIEELAAWVAGHPNARAHVRLKGGTNDTQVVRVRK